MQKQVFPRFPARGTGFVFLVELAQVTANVRTFRTRISGVALHKQKKT